MPIYTVTRIVTHSIKCESNANREYRTPEIALQRSVHSITWEDTSNMGGLLLRLLRPWGTRLATPLPPQTSNRLRFRCKATGCSVSTCLYKNGYVRLYSTFIRQRLDQWQWFPSLMLILHLPELRFVSQLLLEPPAIPTKNKITLIKSSISAQAGGSYNMYNVISPKIQSFQF